MSTRTPTPSYNTTAPSRDSGNRNKPFRHHPGRPGLDEEATDDLAWQRWLATRNGARPDIEARNWLLTRHLDLAKSIAAGYSIRNDILGARDEMASFAIDGLLDALCRFDPDADVAFSTYAAYRIRGAIIDGLRQIDWAPRSVRAFTRMVADAQDRLTAKTGRRPDRSELASELGMTLAELCRAESKEQRSRLASLDVDLTSETGDVMHVADTVADHISDIEAVESRLLAETMLLAMPPRSRLVLYLSVVEGMVLSEVAEILGVTESRVCQIRSQGLRQLRSTFSDLGSDLGVVA